MPNPYERSPSSKSKIFTVRLPAGKRDEGEVYGVKIEAYLKGLPPEVLGIGPVQSLQIMEGYTGSYNLNYHVRVDGKDFIFRINVDQQSGLADQIEYEFRVLKLLEGRRISPRVYHLDNSRKSFEFGILIEEYISGPYLNLEPEEMPDVADLLVRLHSHPIANVQMIAWSDPLVNNYAQVQSDVMSYEARKASDPRIVRLSRRLLTEVESKVHQSRHLYQTDSLNHTDLAIDNFIRTSDGLRLIDWEKPRLDDHTYDLCCFLAAPTQLWCSPKLLSAEGRMRLLSAYAVRSGESEEMLVQKVRIREPLVSLHWIMWSGTKLCDLREGRTSGELVECHEAKVERWERSASVENVERLFDMLL
jgi:thiamine kinase-like enzyme